MGAALSGHREICELLFKAGANPLAVDDNNSTAMHLAAENGKKEVVQLFLQHKSLIEAKDKKGNTPLMLAESKGYREICEILRKATASSPVMTESDQKQSMASSATAASTTATLDNETIEKLKALPEKHNALAEKVQKLAVIDANTLHTLQGRSEQLLRLFEEETKTTQNSNEKTQINANPNLQVYYQFFARLLNGTWMACQSINSGMVDNSETYKTDYVGQGLDQIGQRIPGISLVTGFFSAAIKGWNFREKKQAVQRMALLFPDLDTAFSQISQLARHVTLAQQNEITSMQPPKGIKQKLTEGVKDLTAWIIAEDANTPLKRKAEEDCKKLITAIKEGEITTQPTLSELLSLILGTKVNYRPIASSSEVISPSTAAAAPAAAPASPQSPQTDSIVIEQLREMQKRDAEREVEMKRMKDELAKLKAQMPSDEETMFGDDEAQLKLSKSKQLQSPTAAAADAGKSHIVQTTMLTAHLTVTSAKVNEHSDDIARLEAEVAALRKKNQNKDCIIA